MLTFAVCAVCLALLYWWLMAKTQGQQMAAAGIVGVVVALPLAALAALAELPFHFEWSWLGLLLRRLPAKVAGDLGLVALALWKVLVVRTRVTGGYQRIDFQPGGADAASAVRRALVLAAVSLPPNSFAVDVEGKRSLLVHQLMSKPEPTRDGWPI